MGAVSTTDAVTLINPHSFITNDPPKIGSFPVRTCVTFDDSAVNATSTDKAKKKTN